MHKGTGIAIGVGIGGAIGVATGSIAPWTSLGGAVGAAAQSRARCRDQTFARRLRRQAAGYPDTMNADNRTRTRPTRRENSIAMMVIGLALVVIGFSLPAAVDLYWAIPLALFVAATLMLGTAFVRLRGADPHHDTIPAQTSADGRIHRGAR